MTTITIERTENKNIPQYFPTEQDLLYYLLERYNTTPTLVQVDIEQLSTEDQEAYHQHKQEGYDDFVDL